MIFMAGLLAVCGGCHRGSGNPSGTVSLTGYVSYTRTPVTYDTSTSLATSGQPTGLGTPAGTTPARNVLLRAFQLTLDVDATGRLNQVWRLVATAVTDLNGYYVFPAKVFAGYSTFVELDSVFQQAGDHQSTLQIIADPNGIASTVAEPHRPIYAYRLDVNGNQVIDPVASDPLSTSYPVPVITGNVTLNFSLGSSDTWVSTVPNWYVAGSNPAYPSSSTQPQAPISGSFPGMGSKLLGILDDAYLVSIWYGDPTPSLVHGGVFDLHYYPGRTDALPAAPLPAASPRRSYVIYDTSLTPLSFDGTKSHYFGTLAAGPTFDDAWDQGVIYPMLTRNYLFGQGKTALFPTGLSSLPSEAPDLALVDGLADAMAANLLTTPWLTDTSATATVPFTPRDIRVIPAQAGTGSPATAAALAWQLSLVGTNITPPGTWANWNTNWTYGSPSGLTYPPVMSRLYGLIYPYTQYPGAYKNTVTEPIDIPSIYGQAGRLQEAKNGEPIDLSLVFSDLELYSQLTPYNLTHWPVNWSLDLTAWPYQSTDWDSTPNPTPGALLTTLPSFTLSMANAQQVPNPALVGNASATTPVYPNVSQGEVAYAKLSLFLDQNFSLGLTASYQSGGATVQGLPAGATIEVVVDPAIVSPALPSPQPQTFYFSTSTPGPYSLILAGNPTDHTNPVWHWVRFRLISPTILQPDVQITPSLQ
jgi:hypothetical protein